MRKSGVLTRMQCRLVNGGTHRRTMEAYHPEEGIIWRCISCGHTWQDDSI